MQTWNPPVDQTTTAPVQRIPDTRLRWQDHIKAAITDLRGSDRSPYEQHLLDFLRAFVEPRLK